MLLFILDLKIRAFFVTSNFICAVLLAIDVSLSTKTHARSTFAYPQLSYLNRYAYFIILPIILILYYFSPYIIIFVDRTFPST